MRVQMRVGMRARARMRQQRARVWNFATVLWQPPRHEEVVPMVVSLWIPLPTLRMGESRRSALAAAAAALNK